MSGKKMEGNEEQRRAAAREARAHGKSASEIGATLGASKQRVEASPEMTHQERIDLKRQGKQDGAVNGPPEARPGSRDPDTLDRETHPRL